MTHQTINELEQNLSSCTLLSSRYNVAEVADANNLSNVVNLATLQQYEKQNE
jgi:hypothetical protein